MGMNSGFLQVRNRVRAGEISAVESIDAALTQLDRADRELKALTQVLASESKQAAKTVDARLAAGETLPLAGVPFTAKDNIATVIGETSAASRILRGHRSPYNATVIDRLEAAGAVCVAKTNMDEFGMGSSTENSSLHPTRNPWRTTHVPGGSSGGAAAISAATRGMIHLGSDTGGSIRQPASYCGVTGFKPTYGRVSRYGLLAFASSLDQIGCLQASAAECAAVFDAIAGDDPMDTTCSPRPLDPIGPLDGGRLDGVKLGVPKEFFPAGVDAEIESEVRAAIEQFAALGAEIREVSMPHVEHANPVYVLISAAEASSNLARYDGIHYGHRASEAGDLAELYSRSRVEGFGPEVQRRIMVGTFVLSSGYYDAFYAKACRVRNLIRRDFERAFESVDAVIGPTSPVTAFAAGERVADPLALYAVDVLTVPANLAGVPAVSIPCGFSGGAPAELPVGIQLFGRHFEDERLLRVAHAFQTATDHHLRTPPVCAWNH